MHRTTIITAVVLAAVISAVTAARAQPVPATNGAAAKYPGTVPAPLDGCFQLLNHQMPAPDIARLRAGGVTLAEVQRMQQIVSHACIEPAGSTLASYFRSRGIDHPEDVTDIVVTVYGRWLRPEAMRLDQMISARRQYRQNLPTQQKLDTALQLMKRADSNESLLPEAYKAATTVVTQAFDGADLHLPSLSTPTMQIRWQALGRFVVWRVGKLQPLDPERYEEAVGELDPDLSTSTATLDSATLVMSVANDGMGDVMVLSALPGQPTKIWHIGSAAGNKQYDVLRCWAPTDQKPRPCFPKMIGALPNDATGAQRFYVKADYPQPAGCTRGSQLSIWRWTGQGAEPLYATSYAIYCDDPDQGARLHGDVFRIRQKGFFKVLFACGACAGRQLEHRIQITPSGISDLGTTSLTPELDLVDELYARIKAGQNGGDLIAAPAFQEMRQSWAPMRAERFQQLFLNEAETVRRAADRSTLCFLANYVNDPMPPLLFTFTGQGSMLHVINVQENSPDCSR